MLGSDPHAFAIAALTALGADLVEMRGRTTQLFTGTQTDAEAAKIRLRKRRRKSSSSRGSRKSASSRSTTRTGRTLPSCSSTKSLSKASRSMKKGKSKTRSTVSQAANSKASSVGSTESRRRTVLTVAPHPKPEKYVPPPRGTFRSSYTRHLRSEVIGVLVSEIERLGMPEYLSIAGSSEAGESQESSVSSAQEQQIATRPPLITVTAPAPKLKLEDLPTLALAEFDLFSASRSRSATVKETSDVWSRSPAAPSPPQVRRWLKNARKQAIGTLVEGDESQKSEKSGSSGRDSGERREQNG